jgi:flagellar basal-body rod protein FlgB
MDIESIPLFAVLRGRMGYLNQRQQVIAQNVANASTPGFTPQDLRPFTIKSGIGSSLALTPVAQSTSTSSVAMIPIQTQSASQGFRPIAAPDDETKLDGNQVVLEDQMVKMADTRSDYEAAVGIYEKALSFLQMAAKEPGK